MAEVGNPIDSVAAPAAQVPGNTGGMMANVLSQAGGDQGVLDPGSALLQSAAGQEASGTQKAASAETIDEADEVVDDFDEEDDCFCFWNDLDCAFCELITDDDDGELHCDNNDEMFNVLTSLTFKHCGCKSCWTIAVDDVDLDIRVAFPIGQYPAPSYVQDVNETKHPNRNLYDHSTAEELRDFVQDRSLQDPCPGKLTLKWYYIQVLEEADRKPEFDLMGLPTEMRLEVYRQLLVTDGLDQPHTAILGTCKLVRQEASDIFYGENVARCRFAVQGLSVQSSSLLGQELLQTREFDAYPSHLLRVRRLEIHLCYRQSTVFDTHFLLNTFLIKLASFLMDNHSVKHLTIVVDIDKQVEESDYATILYPLRRLRGIHDVQFHGSIPDKYRIRLIDDMGSSKPAYNTLRQMRLLLNESSYHIELLESLTVQEFECDCGECPRIGDRSERLCELRRLRESVEESEEVGFWSVSEEANLQARLGQLKNVLDECSVEQLRRFLEKIEAAEKARKAATDDPSVLDQAASRGVQDETHEGYDWSDID